MRNYKKFWDNFNTGHYLNVLTEREMARVKKEIEQEFEDERMEFKERFAVLIGFMFLLASMVLLFKALEVFYV